MPPFLACEQLFILSTSNASWCRKLSLSGPNSHVWLIGPAVEDQSKRARWHAGPGLRVSPERAQRHPSFLRTRPGLTERQLGARTQSSGHVSHPNCVRPAPPARLVALCAIPCSGDGALPGCIACALQILLILDQVKKGAAAWPLATRTRKSYCAGDLHSQHGRLAKGVKERRAFELRDNASGIVPSALPALPATRTLRPSAPASSIMGAAQLNPIPDCHVTPPAAGIMYRVCQGFSITGSPQPPLGAECAGTGSTSV